MYVSHLPDMHETCEEDDGERRAVVFDDYSDVMLEEGTCTDHITKITDN
jgi:hypothetical protein